MISKALLEKLFRGTCIQRWNDLIRPIELTELDKQAHKAMIAYVFSKYELETEEGGIGVNVNNLIEGIIFEYLERTVLTDIKPPVFDWLRNRVAEDITGAVLSELESDINTVNSGFSNRFRKYLLEPGYSPNVKRILGAAHWYASDWEFDLIKDLNTGREGIGDKESQIQAGQSKHSGLICIKKVTERETYHDETHKFIDLMGQLRFQQRWAQTPRIPRTSVLGHMFLVGLLAYLFCLEMEDVCPRLRSNSFFSGLFHDIPEAITRDIVEPVKRFGELRSAIKDYEDDQIQTKILPLLPESWRANFEHLLTDEVVEEAEGVIGHFKSKVRLPDQSITPSVPHETIFTEHNTDDKDPISGLLIKGCDALAGCMEAALSIEAGISTSALVRGRDSYYEKYAGIEIGGFRFRPYFDYFRKAGL